jgi:hypothetical protein
MKKIRKKADINEYLVKEEYVSVFEATRELRGKGYDVEEIDVLNLALKLRQVRREYDTYFIRTKALDFIEKQLEIRKELRHRLGNQ